MTPAAATVALTGLVVAGAAIGHATAGPADVGPAIVVVGSGSGTGGVATGFVVGTGRVLTVAHVLPAGTTTVRGADGVARGARVVRRDESLDLAVLAVPGLRYAVARRAGGTRMLVRHGGGVRTVPVRILRRIDAAVRTAGVARAVRRPALELAATASPGDSGAPVMDGGRIAGVVFARSSTRPGIAYAVDASVLDRLLR